MSLINKMLQDLEARSSDNISSATGYGHVRAVADRANTHSAWFIAIGLTLVLSVAVIAMWLWMRQPGAIAKPTPAIAAIVVPAQPQALPLKLASDMTGAVNAAAETGIAKIPNDMPVPAVAADKANVEVKTSRAVEVTSPIRATEPPSTLRATPISTPATMAMAVAPGPVPVSARVLASAIVAAPLKSEQLASQATVTPPAKAIESNAPITLNKQVKELTAQQRAENEYRRASTLMQQQSRTPEAITVLEQALQLDPQHVAARQTLVGLLMENKRTDDAILKLQEGLTLDPSQQGFAMILARLQVEKGELKPAIDTLQRTLPYAAERDDYQAFLAALLQRQARHKEAIEHYQLVLRHAPQNGLWWMGLAISLQAENRLGEAQEAYNRAKTSNTLSPELHAFVEQKLVLLQR